ncbi:MAG: histidine kinase [Myxococcota bacterium]
MTRRTSLFIVAFWLFIGLVYMLSLYLDGVRFGSGFEFSLTNLVMFESAYGSWALLTLALLAVLRGPIIERRFLRATLVFAGGLLLWLPLFTLVDGFVAWLLTGASVQAHLVGVRATYLFFHSVLYIVVFVSCAVLIYYFHSLRMERAAAELEQKTTKAELGAVTWQLRSLQSQLSPHFLFNALNSLSGMARSSQNRDLVSALARLGDMLRFVLETGGRSTITVGEEVDFTRHYVALQRLRFGERYRFELEYDDEMQTRSCPPFVLQPLVENAFTHAVQGSSEVVTIQAQIAYVSDRILEFRVRNTRGSVIERTNGNRHDQARGSGHREHGPYSGSDGDGHSSGMGMALSNLKERLQLVYEEDCGVFAESSNQDYIATVRIPAMSYE